MSNQPSDHHSEEPIEEFFEEIVDDSALLANALGGWKGILDSGLPSIVFILGYMVSDHDLRVSVWAALTAAATLAVIRLIQKQSLQQVFSGLLGVGIAAYLTSKTGSAENFFLPGILTNLAYGVVCLVSIAIKRPVLGFVIAGMRGQDMSWRHDPKQHRLFSTATWIWTLVFGIRVGLMLPLYFAGKTEALGVLKIILGWPLFALGAYATYRLLTAAKIQDERSEKS